MLNIQVSHAVPLQDLHMRSDAHSATRVKCIAKKNWQTSLSALSSYIALPDSQRGRLYQTPSERSSTNSD